jgi:hypothetical protein
MNMATLKQFNYLIRIVEEGGLLRQLKNYLLLSQH